MTTTRHPAKFTDTILDAIAPHIRPGWRVLDPFAGTGRIHALAERCGATSVGVEIEPEWAELHPLTVVGNALDLPADWTCSFDAVVTSPTYGNRMADHHEAKDSSRRITYRHTLGRALNEENSGKLQWGKRYREFHERAWAEAARVARHRIILNASDHIRAGERQHVTSWHVDTIEALGFVPVGIHEVPTPRMRLGANASLRVAHEYVVVFDRATPCTRKEAA